MSAAAAQTALLAGRFAQYLAAALLFGAPLFGLYALRGEAVGGRMVRQLALLALAVAGAAAWLVLMGQAAAMTGDPAGALSPAAWLEVLSGSQFGRAWLVRLGLIVATAAAVLRRSSRWTYLPMAVTGGLLLASLAWMGHGAADEGARGLVHLVADVAHLLAAGAWLGALVPLTILVDRAARASGAALSGVACRALERFSGVGSAVVAALVLSGLVNGGFLLGASFPASLAVTRYGRVLLAKLAMFVAMLGLAALHRWRSVPRLARAVDFAETAPPELRGLTASLALETALGFGVMALVAWLGVIEPPIDLG